MIRLSWGGITDTGPVRDINEDSMLLVEPVFAVADGMGGHAAGEVASALAARGLEDLALQAPLRVEDVLAAVTAINDAIVDAQHKPGQRGMGTTVAALVLVEHEDSKLWLVAHVGDSRVYRLADGALELLTRDHTEVQEYIDAGLVSEAGRRGHPRANLLTKVLGMEQAPEPDCRLLWPSPGERFLICSDGLPAVLDADEIASLLGDVDDPESAARALVDAAVSGGAHDNVTCAVVDTVAVDGPVDDPAGAGLTQSA